MAIATIRPDGVALAGNGISLVGAASANAAISDQNNSTYIQRTGSTALNGTDSRYTLANPSLSNVTIRSVNCYVYGFTHNFVNFGPYTTSGVDSLSGSVKQIAEGTTTPQWVSTGKYTTRPYQGGNWTLTDINNLQFRFWWENHIYTSDISRVIEAYVEVEYYRAPGVPTAVIPANGAAVGKPNPDLSANLTASGDGQRQHAEWQFATNTGFTTSVKTVVGTTSIVSGTVTASPTTSQLDLAAGTWYMRCRGVDEFGVAGSWSSTATITVSHIVGAINQSPTGDATLQYAATNRFSWVFSGPSSSSVQTAYQIVVENNDTGATVKDTGKVTSTNKYADIALGTGAIDQPLRWKIQLWDGSNTTQGYGNYQLFRVSNPPTVTISAPAAGGTVTTGQPTVTWSNDANTVQQSRRVVFKRQSDGAVLHDSGTTATSSQSYTPSTNILSNGLTFTVTVYVTDTVGLSGNSTNTFTTSYVAPNAVTYSVDGNSMEWDGYVLVDWSSTTPDASFASWRVYRRYANTGEDWELIFTTDNANIRQYEDWLAGANDYWEYSVTQMALRSGELVESGVNASPLPVLASSTHYWIIDPQNTDNSLRLDQVTADTYTEAYDQAELVIIGRGRKVNLGTRHGYDGSLTVKMRDDAQMTARQKRRKLQALRENQTEYYLRNPFGDTLKISLGDLQFGRIAGVGTNEWVDVTVPYKEVS